MLTCKEATALMSQGLDRKLTFAERFGLRLHVLICRGCRATERHLEFLRTVTTAWRERHAAPSIRQGDQA